VTCLHRPGCPIRRPPVPRLPAPPRSISSRGHVLLRPSTPRHPPCALFRGYIAIAFHHGFTRQTGSRRTAPKGHASNPLPRPFGRLPPCPRCPRSSPRWRSAGRCCSSSAFVSVSVDVGNLAVRTRTGAPIARSSLPRPQGLGGPAHLIVNVQFPAGAVEPRGFEPRTSALQTRRSPRLSYGPLSSFAGSPDVSAGVGAPGLEPGASALSGPRSDRLSYAPRCQPCRFAQ
jgi:hypothetical protein